MRQEAGELLMMRGAIASMPQEEQDAIRAAALEMRDMLKRQGEKYGCISMALVGLEIAAGEFVITP